MQVLIDKSSNLENISENVDSSNSIKKVVQKGLASGATFQEIEEAKSKYHAKKEPASKEI